MGGQGSGRRPQETCQEGHELVGDNLIINKRKNGKVERACRKCENRRQREFWERKRNGKR